MIEMRGMYVAAVTPRGREGDIDFGAVFEILDHLCAAGVDGIVLFGAAGEYPALEAQERSRLVYLAVKRSRVPVLVGVGSASLDASVALAREARDGGAAALLIPPPFFFRYQQDDLREFYNQFAAQVGEGTPLLVSNTPEFTSGIASTTALELLETGRYAGIEEAGSDLEAFACLKAVAAAQGFGLLAGNDRILTSARFGEGGGEPGARPACGAISEAGCAIPELLMGLDRAMTAGDRETVARLDALLDEFLGWVEQFPRPLLIKEATGLRGLQTGPHSLPLAAAKEKKLEEFREWFAAWLPETKRTAGHV
jgi:dihydrodipicolinate synthase/N-acetylneuraminate lyase